MPLLYIHLSVAKDAADVLQHPLLEPNMACYLGGSISPDAHLVSNASRKETHFFDLNDTGCESGTSMIFTLHSHLTDGRKMGSATKSFIAGYLSHLITDETWILDIYRPFFGNDSPLNADPMANVYDRLLQFEVDRRERQDKTKLAIIQTELCKWEPEACMDFITIEALSYWREFGCASVNREITLADFSTFAKGFLQPKLNMDDEQMEQFLSSIQYRLDWVTQYVSQERIESFRHKSVKESVATLKEYLDADN